MDNLRHSSLFFYLEPSSFWNSNTTKNTEELEWIKVIIGYDKINLKSSTKQEKFEEEILIDVHNWSLKKRL